MTVELIEGDSRQVLKELADNSIHSVVTDPPYALVSVTKRFGKAGSKEPKVGATGVYNRGAAGFMGKTWDNGDTAFDPEFWVEVMRVLKPGGHVLAFGGTRTYHRLACAIEDAGFEIRDQIGWLYGSGFPKSHNQSGEWEGWGTALKPAWEPIVVARKALDGTNAANLRSGASAR
jgi:site-specific DNA-methyltransferase (adenine-specific)